MVRRMVAAGAGLVLLAACSSGDDAGASTERADVERTSDDGDDRDDAERRSAVDDEDSTRGDDDGGDPEGQEAAAAPGPTPTVDGAVTCPAATVEVADADALAAALDAAAPGDVIGIAPGTYRGKFVATADAGSDPIWLCGSREVVLDGGGIKQGYALHLDGAAGWRLVGFTVRNAQKGVMADHATGNVIQGLLVEDIGDEAIHLRAFSTDNVVRGNEVRDTGQRREKFGEGIYVGSAESNWCRHTDCDPDRSDRNEIVGNLVYGTTAEGLDVKEGTADGIARDNVFGGDALSGADSWVDAKGNDWVFERNTGIGSPQDGFQMHEILDGWGTGNVFVANVARVDGPGHGFAATNTEGNVVRCDNEVTGAGSGFADVDCVP